MQKYLYADLYELEEKHWWHIAKRENVETLLLRYLDIKRPKILDIGCGTGKNIEAFSAIGPTFGIDKSTEAIDYCKKRGIETVVLGSAEETPLLSNSFDVVTLLDVLEHTDDRKTLKEIYRILKQGGLLVITVPAFPWLWSRWDEVLHHKRRYTKQSLIRTLSTYNFRILKISYMFSFLLLPTYVIRSIKSWVSRKNYSSDFRLNNPVVNLVFLALSKIESFFVKNWSVPFGTSLICIARKTL